MNYIHHISARLSLRQPQRRSLELLADVADTIPLNKTRDTAAALEQLKATYPTVTDFEREFPSLCFALATGVGKTRLMGAFISYLYLQKRIKHFFVMAPNLTIYNKLIADFTPNTRKYVFQGIAEFAQEPPEIITGDNYESGRGVRKQDMYGETGVHINIFNISKINSEVRGGNAPRIKRLAEYIGQSYFDYLAELPDLVLLMDESHRYRASAGVKAINELKPILGLELTATPQIEAGGKQIPFKNVIYSYPLSAALSDGFVKEPVAATRENFDASQYDEAQLEKLKLEDGVRVHEQAKVELEVYARQNGRAQVKPFMLVVAKDTTHAEEILRFIKSDLYFEGRYKDKVITVHSNQRGEEGDETVARLLAVEDPKEPTEIVIHVNMLKEGWDVTNLYTVVPLRAANSKTLVEQSIGRGLRLPYGERTGNKAVDRLTIIAHDKFQEIIDEANNPNSLIRAGVIIGVDVPLERKEAVFVPPLLDTTLAQAVSPAVVVPGAAKQEQGKLMFPTPVEQEIAKTTLAVIESKFQSLSKSYDLTKPEVQASLVKETAAAYGRQHRQGTLEGVEEIPDVATIVQKAVQHFIHMTIDIPRIHVEPKGAVVSGFKDFDLDLATLRLLPVSMDILLHNLRTNEQERLTADGTPIKEARLEDYLVSKLMDFNDIDYDRQSELLYKLAGQVVAHLKSYLKDADEVENVLQYHRRSLAELIHTQMQPNYFEHSTEYGATVSKGFTQLKPGNYTKFENESARNFRVPVDEKRLIQGALFTGFAKCLYPFVRFQSDSERRFSLVIENDKSVLKWLKPEKGQISIYYRFNHGEHEYVPDFVVEAEDRKYLCEPKQTTAMNDPAIEEKKRAAEQWCRYASEHAKQNGGKPWTYVLIPHDEIKENMTLAGLVAKFGSK